MFLIIKAKPFIIQFVLALMNINLLKALQILFLGMLILTPLLIICNYEAYVLDIQDKSQYQELIMQTTDKLGQVKIQNKKDYQVLRQKIQTKWGSQLQLKQQIITTFDQIFKNTMEFSPLLVNSYYKSNLIINVQLTSVFYSQKDKIQEQIISQLKWFSQQFLMNLTIIPWREGMNLNELKPCLIIVVRELRYEYIEQNIVLKLRRGDYRNNYYIKEIVEQLKSLPSFSHCKFISTRCTQASIIFVNHNQEKEQTIWQANRMYFIDEFDQKLIFNILSSILQMDPIMQLLNLTHYSRQVSELYQIKKSQYIQDQLQKNLLYISHILKPTHFNATTFLQKINSNSEQGLRYLRNGQFISPYIHNQQEKDILNKLFSILLQQNSSKIELDQNILTDNRVGVIDTFPNDFKIGVYLPLFFIFIYPFFLKIKQGLTNLYKYARNSLQ